MYKLLKIFLKISLLTMQFMHNRDEAIINLMVETIDWRKIYAFRNVLAHDYFGIYPAEVWEIIQKHIPKLKEELEAIWLSKIKTGYKQAQSQQHLAPNPFPLNASYFETLGLYSFSPRAMAPDPKTWLRGDISLGTL